MKGSVKNIGQKGNENRELYNNNLGNYIHLYSITLVKGCKRILY